MPQECLPRSSTIGVTLHWFSDKMSLKVGCDLAEITTKECFKVEVDLDERERITENCRRAYTLFHGPSLPGTVITGHRTTAQAMAPQTEGCFTSASVMIPFCQIIL